MASCPSLRKHLLETMERTVSSESPNPSQWTEERPNVKTGDVILLKDPNLARFQWPVGIVESVFPSDHDNRVRKVHIRIIRDGKSVVLTRPITEMVLLIN